MRLPIDGGGRADAPAHPLDHLDVIPFDRDREEAELREYLGDAYDRRRLEGWEREPDAEFARLGDEALFYRRSEGYLYNLTAFAMTGAKLPYLRDLARLVPRATTLLDYGCGIGSDGLCLMEAGYDVAFADFDNPSTRYLRWRLERRGTSGRIYDLDRESPPTDFGLAYAFDVIEHVDDPFAFLDRLERHARLVLVNLLEPETDGTVLHRELPVRRLLRRAARGRVIHVRRYHGRSHLVLYDREPARGLSRAASLARLARTHLPDGRG